MKQTFEIAAKMPSLNELIRAKGAFGGGAGKRWNGYNAMKKQWSEVVAQASRRYGIKHVERARLGFEWHESTWRRDPDNVSSGGRKLILDSLVKTGLLPGDGPKNVHGFSDAFAYGAERDLVVITLEEVERD